MDEMTRAVTECWPGETEFVVLTAKEWKLIRTRLQIHSGFDELYDVMMLPITLEDDVGSTHTGFAI